MKFLKTSFFVIVLLLICANALPQGTRGADSLLRKLEQTGSPDKKIPLQLELSYAYELSNPRKALDYARQAEETAMSISDWDAVSRALLRASRIYYTISDLQNALDYANKAKEVADQHDLPVNSARALDGIGVIYYDIGDEGKSSDCFFSSLKVYEGLKDKIGIGQSLCRIGTLYYKQNENQKAVDYYTRSLEIARELKDREGIASNLSNLATVYTSEKEYSKALASYSEALKLNRETGNIQLEGRNFLDMGSLYLKMGKYDSAMELVNRSLEIFNRVGNQVRYAKAQVVAGDIYLKQLKLDQGLEMATSALDTSWQHGYREIVYDAAGLLHRIYLARHDTVRAYRYAILEAQWKDSLALAENKKTLDRLELQYQFDKREQQAAIEKQRKNYTIVILGLLIVFSSIVILLLWSRYLLARKKSRLEKKSLEMDLEYKKKELTLNVISLMKKNEMLAEITQRIIAIKQEASQEETRSALNKVVNELRKSTDDQILKEFSLRFKEVHSEFYDTLLKKYPALTPGELKLCAFLRLNMTTKEISELTGQQISSLENARYRLRQKLGITSSDVNLVTFLAQI